MPKLSHAELERQDRFESGEALERVPRRRHDGRERLLEALLKDEPQAQDGGVVKDVSALLGAPGRFPMRFWRQGFVLQDITDLCWRRFTAQAREVFPATLRHDHVSHPGYVKDVLPQGKVRIIPLSTKRSGKRYIKAGTRLQLTGFPWDRDSYLVMRGSCLIPQQDRLFEQLPRYLGVHPYDEMAGNGQQGKE